MENHFNEIQQNKIEKPPFLYHASPIKNIKEISIRSENTRDAKEGDVVFATPDLALVGAFLTGFNDSWANLGKINGIPYFVIGDKEKFIESDNGGAVYKLDSKSFSFELDKGLGEDEWTSRENVKPIEQIDVDSILDFMLDNGLQVYFFDKQKFQEFKVLPKTGNIGKMIEILKSEISENQKSGVNIKNFSIHLLKMNLQIPTL